MTYEEAIKFKQENKYRIGTVDDKDFMVNDLLIVPTNKERRDSFLRDYVFNPQQAQLIHSFQNEDVEVWAVDTSHVEKANVLFYHKLQ